MIAFIAMFFSLTMVHEPETLYTVNSDSERVWLVRATKFNIWPSHLIDSINLMRQTGTFPRLVEIWKCPSQWGYFISSREWTPVSFSAIFNSTIIIKEQSSLFIHLKIARSRTTNNEIMTFDLIIFLHLHLSLQTLILGLVKNMNSI